VPGRAQDKKIENNPMQSNRQALLLRISGSTPLDVGVEIPQQPMQAEADEDGKQHEVRQAKKNSVAPQLDLLARADRQPIDDARRGRVVTYGA
jgi:hypothetical protein